MVQINASSTTCVPVVLDIGSGSSKIGFAGNLQPSHVFATAISSRAIDASSTDLSTIVGPTYVQRGSHYDVTYPVQHGAVQDWSQFEEIIYSSLCQRLQVNTQEHGVLLTECPLNPPERRENAAEVLFETFRVPALHIGVQAVLALYAEHALASSSCEVAPGQFARPLSTVLPELTGTVVDAGDGVTHVVPIIDGFVVSSAIRSAPLSGATATAYLQRSLRARGEPMPAEASMEFCRTVKERLAYTCKDPQKEMAKLERDPASLTRVYCTGDGVASVAVGAERFMAPEVFFSPELAGISVPPLHEVVDQAIQACPIDSRRQLYSSILLAGGATRFQNFDRRLKLEVQRRVDTRLTSLSTGVPVRVCRHRQEDWAAWVGGSLMGAAEDFPLHCYSRQEYDEVGPSLCRQRRVARD